MKIDDRSDLGGISGPGVTSAAGVDSGSRRTTSGGSAGPGSDSVELSGLAGKISHAVSQDAVDRSAKVDQLRSQVANGSYQPDSTAISNGIVKESLAAGAVAGSSGK